MFIKTDEGQRHLAAGNALPQECLLGLKSAVRGGWNSTGNSKGKGGKEPRGEGGGEGTGNDGKGKGNHFDDIQCHGCEKCGHFAWDCPDRSIEAVKDEDGASLQPQLCHTHGYRFVFQWLREGKWFSVSNIDQNEDEPAHVAQVPKPEANWERIKRPSSATANRTKPRFMPSCAEECACATSNPWESLNDEQHAVSSKEFPTAEEAASIPSEHTRT